MKSKNFFFVILFFSGLAFNAQTSKIIINIDGMFSGNTLDREYTFAYLVTSQNVTVRSSNCIESEVVFEEVMMGNYHIEVRRGDTLFLTFHNINITDDNIYRLNVDDYKPHVYNTGIDSIRYTLIEGGFNFSYSPRQLNPANKLLNETYKFGFYGNSIFPTAKHIGFGVNYGTSNDYTGFRKDSTGFRARYLAWNVFMGCVFRIAGYDLKKETKDGFKFDMGVNYNFPIYFRYAVIDGTKRYEEKGIHQYTDFYAFSRFGYKNVVVTAEYALISFLIGKHPEMYPLRVGINFLWLAD